MIRKKWMRIEVGEDRILKGEVIGEEKLLKKWMEEIKEKLRKNEKWGNNGIGKDVIKIEIEIEVEIEEELKIVFRKKMNNEDLEWKGEGSIWIEKEMIEEIEKGDEMRKEKVREEEVVGESEERIESVEIEMNREIVGLKKKERGKKRKRKEIRILKFIEEIGIFEEILMEFIKEWIGNEEIGKLGESEIEKGMIEVEEKKFMVDGRIVKLGNEFLKEEGLKGLNGKILNKLKEVSLKLRIRNVEGIICRGWGRRGCRWKG